ncbi:hypothetical protein A2952_03315 [Candidatus Kaiserbacteria bacterium RIFCSPLOWO2_01_FULL_59_34]|nr:MAG: hypothetical protein A2766_04365 [Candidatus Kaiserbacteria bacterium RIFCSPHIGHO2_01_FULL_58_22]OGG78921.1 MAG: hypothetical protein A2952_03315 [Candidatus Kaiserbacteria bacterium RIFCSPLOWO2_01_FULL_59_34]
MNFAAVARTIWRWVRWPLLALAVLYIALVVYRAFVLVAEDETRVAVENIHAERLTMDDVDGKHLPPPPDLAQVDATIEGIDANGNGIRDDVEFAIFEKYPNDIKIRAATLQYAKALQQGLTQVTNSGTWIAASQQEERSLRCILENVSQTSISKWSEIREEVRESMLNTSMRTKKYEELSKYQTSFSLLEDDNCDPTS